MNKVLYERKEVAQLTGLCLVTIDKWLKREHNPLPSIKIGRRVMIPVDAFMDWIAKETERNQRGA